MVVNRQIVQDVVEREQGRKVRGKARSADLVDLLRLLEVLQPMLAHVAQVERPRRTGLQRLEDGMRDEDLLAVTDSSQPRAPVDRRAIVVLVADFGAPAVQSHADFDRPAFDPRLGMECVLKSDSRADAVDGALENGEEAVALSAALYDPAVTAFDDLGGEQNRAGLAPGASSPRISPTGGCCLRCP